MCEVCAHYMYVCGRHWRTHEGGWVAAAPPLGLKFF
jgi:hypothetical protein